VKTGIRVVLISRVAVLAWEVDNACLIINWDVNY
jgi:hypothetical protein